MTDQERGEIAAIVRDIAFTNLAVPTGAVIRGLFRSARGYPAHALFVVHKDGSEWLYTRSGERKRWRSASGARRHE